MAKPAFYSSGQDSPRLLVPLALVSVLTTLIEELPEQPDSKRAELRTLRTRLCRLYQLTDPASLVSEVDAAHLVAEEDGEEVPDTI